MAKTFRKGDKVTWSSHGGPQYLVRSESGSGEAVHKPSALRRA